MQIGKNELKLSLFAGAMIMYLVEPGNSTRKLLEIISEFNKEAGYKINAHKSKEFYT